MILKNYQQDAICRLANAFERCLNSDSKDICVYESPTGSGKTVTCAHLLKAVVQKKISPRPISVIWVSVRKLHAQSKHKLEKIYQNNMVLECSEFDDLEDNEIHENEIWFVNWESINKINNSIIIRENENEKYLEKIIQNTKKNGRYIILVIDESHHTATSQRSTDLIKQIDPKITLEVSATPEQKGNATELVRTHINRVKEEEMIKNQIIINPKIDQGVVNDKSTTELVIEHSVKKQKTLKEMYEKEGVDINPLILVQLPDSRAGVIDKMDEIIDAYRKYGITEESNRLAKWLSEEKSPDLEHIAKNDNKIDVLVFKQAIAVGWDCPRASILVVFRETKSMTFTIQVIGRIMRMPQQKHYIENPELNYGYIFTNLERIELATEYVKDYASTHNLERDNSKYRPIKLLSTYIKRPRERTRLSGKFLNMFYEAAVETDLAGSINQNVDRITSRLIVDGKIDDIDVKTSITAGEFKSNISDIEIQRSFDLFVMDACRPFAPFDSSDRLKTTLYNWLYENFKIEKLSAEAQIKIIASENIMQFYNTIHIAKEKYKSEINKNNLDVRKSESKIWEVPLEQSISNAKDYGYKKSIMKPGVVQIDSDVEKDFLDAIDASEKVVWWYKNGKREVKYFAIPYEDNFGLKWAFYVDFIIKFKNGTIGVFDTKSGTTAASSKNKAEALIRYIRENNTRERPLMGGIIIPTDYGWAYNANELYEYNPNDLSEWTKLDI